MDQGSYWTWMRRKLIEKSHAQAPTTYNNESWEEQAFAQDSAGVLGGCIWPPRSYTCSFCRREFRSAQALGGHMNVHRRDRARLKQSPNPNTCERLPHNPHQSHFKSLGVHPSQVSCLEYKKNHISDPNSVMASPLSSSRVSILSPQENCREHAFVPSVKDDDHHKMSLTCDPQMRPNSFCVRVLKVSDSNIEEKNSMAQDVSLLDKGEDNIFKSDSSLNLNLVLHRNRSFTESSFDYDDDDDELPSKKQKIDATSLPFFLKPCSVGRHHLQSDVLGLDPSKIEELDLELRLGERPQVK